MSQALPLATQADVEAAIAKVADLEETEFAAQPRDAKVNKTQTEIVCCFNILVWLKKRNGVVCKFQT